MAAMKAKLYFMNTDGMSEEELARVLDKLECKECGKIFHKEFGLQYHVANDHWESIQYESNVAIESIQRRKN